MTTLNEASMDPSIQRKVQALGKEIEQTKSDAVDAQKASADQLKTKVDQLKQRKQKIIDAEKMRAQNQSGAIGQETGTVQPIADKAVAAKALKPMTVQDKEAIAHKKDDRVAAAVKNARKKINTQPNMATPHTKGHDNMREEYGFPDAQSPLLKPVKAQAPVDNDPREIHAFQVTVSKGGENKHLRKATIKTVHGKDHALLMALNHYKEQGYEIHDHKQVKESVDESYEQIDELSNATLQSYKDKAMKSSDELTAQGKHKEANDRLMNHMKASGKQITKTMSNIRSALKKEGYNHHDNRTGFGKRHREDDEYHVPDPVTTTHKIVHTVSKDGVEGGAKHNRMVTISNSTKSHSEAKAAARAHLEKQGYKIHESTIAEGAYEKSEENKKSADAAKKQGDMFAHHLHMADHHDNLAQWHSEKGRHGEADRHAAKAEEHHEKAMTFKESTILEDGEGGVAANSVAAGGIAGFKGDAGKKAVMTKVPLKRKTLQDVKIDIKK